MTRSLLNFHKFAVGVRNTYSDLSLNSTPTKLGSVSGFSYCDSRFTKSLFVWKVIPYLRLSQTKMDMKV